MQGNAKPTSEWDVLGDWPHPWAWRLAALLYQMIACAPLLLLGALYLMAYRGAQHLGVWPEPYINDPKFIVYGDGLYDFLSELAFVLLGVSAWGWLILPFGVFLARHTPRWRHLLLVGLFVLGWILLFHDPTDRLFWYMD